MARDFLAEPPSLDAPDDDTPLDFTVPPEIGRATRAATTPAFLLRGGLVDAWFTRRSDVLLVTFDNLSSIGQRNPPQPWLQLGAARAGASILGIMASRKDWYRNDDTPKLITALKRAGFFRQFRRVIFTGASMGGFAALAYSSLVPGSTVLAFSPQSTLARRLAPFERRYTYAQKAWDWAKPGFLDGAAATATAARIFLVYDPFVPEDKQHAARITGPQVRHIHAGHMGHRAIRLMKTTGALQLLIDQVVQDRFDPTTLAGVMRGRRTELAWQRALFGEAERRNHPQLVLSAARTLMYADPEAPYPARVTTRFAAICAQTAPVPRPMQEILTVDAGPTAAPFNHHLARLTNALVVPERDHDRRFASGVLLADRSYCTLSRTWIRAGKAMPEPQLADDEPITDLPGRHLFAGHFRAHFGHFLVESTARLWALDHVKPGYDSILYLPYRGEPDVAAKIEAHAGFFRLLGIETPIRSHASVQRVEELHVPELGFGWQDRYAGSPAYRQFMQSRLNAAVAAEGSDKLYISRARLNPQHGGILCETVIEENLARLGYEIFHPERHPLAVQIARYKAARQVIALDGSALHLAAYVLQPSARVAMILRRSRANAADYVLQFKNFAGITPHVIDVISRDWVSANAARVDFRSIGEIDFSALFGWLKGLGMVPPDFRAALPDVPTIRAVLDSFQDKRGAPFRPLIPGEPYPELAQD